MPGGSVVCRLPGGTLPWNPSGGARCGNVTVGGGRSGGAGRLPVIMSSSDCCHARVASTPRGGRPGCCDTSGCSRAGGACGCSVGGGAWGCSRAGGAGGASCGGGACGC